MQFKHLKNQAKTRDIRRWWVIIDLTWVMR